MLTMIQTNMNKYWITVHIKLIQLIELLTSYTTKNWTALEKDLLHYYDADQKKTQYIIRDLIQFTQQWKHHLVRTLTKWKIYEWKFITIGGWLLARKKISDNKQAAYLWKGINRSLREWIENRLAAWMPTLSLTEAFPMAEVIKVVGSCLWEINWTLILQTLILIFLDMMKTQRHLEIKVMKKTVAKKITRNQAAQRRLLVLYPRIIRLLQSQTDQRHQEAVINKAHKSRWCRAVD
jgi:hypothetical protein